MLFSAAFGLDTIALRGVASNHFLGGAPDALVEVWTVGAIATIFRSCLVVAIVISVGERVVEPRTGASNSARSFSRNRTLPCQEFDLFRVEP
ncbi:MAG: hypothetical protein WDO74_36370 [Pseudomonadota bacterium]